jgi:hypothetical protein
MGLPTYPSRPSDVDISLPFTQLGWETDARCRVNVALVISFTLTCLSRKVNPAVCAFELYGSWRTRART